MTTENIERVVDGDGHLVEDHQGIWERMPEAYRDRSFVTTRGPFPPQRPPARGQPTLPAGGGVRTRGPRGLDRLPAGRRGRQDGALHVERTRVRARGEPRLGHRTGPRLQQLGVRRVREPGLPFPGDGPRPAAGASRGGDRAAPHRKGTRVRGRDAAGHRRAPVAEPPRRPEVLAHLRGSRPSRLRHRHPRRRARPHGPRRHEPLRPRERTRPPVRADGQLPPASSSTACSTSTPTRASASSRPAAPGSSAASNASSAPGTATSSTTRTAVSCRCATANR